MDNVILKNKRILLVEDDIVNQMLFQRSLAKITTDIDIADTGDKAIGILRSKTFDLIIMDIYLPGIDGCETAAIIRNELKLDLPIIAVTASPIDDELKRCLASGMNGYLRKPFSVSQLSDELEKFLPAPESNNIIGDENLTVDLNFLLGIAENDTEYIRMMIKTFLENMPPVIKKLQQFNSDGDKDNLAKTAHFAKSSLSVIQIQQMFEQAKQIESEAKSKNYSDKETQESIRKFNQLFTRAGEILNNYINTISA